MLKRLKRPSSWMAIAGVVALSLGAVAAKVVLRDSSQLAVPPELAADQTIPRDHDPVFSLVSLPASQRSVELAKLANGPASATRSRARYLLATDYIAADQGGSAIPLLDGLEAEYPLLAPYVLLQRGNAQRAMGQSEAAQASWQTLVDRYGDDPAAADALYALSKLDPAYGDQLLQKFPGHPRSVETALTRLSQDPNRADTLPLLLLVARYGLYRQEAGAVLNRLTNEFADQLSPEDWQTVGFGYWRLDIYGAAGKAYAKAPATPVDLYRAARGLQLGKQRTAAIAFYNRLDQEFPEAPETATGLLKLAEMLPSEQALGVLDQVISRFPDRAAEALLARANVLAALNSPDSAEAARKSILTQYADSATAADLRLQYALAHAEQGDLNRALEWAQETVKWGPETDAAADAGFWAGKWARSLGKADVAQAAFEQVIAYHPESYYAWRAAVALGWNVGDFKTVRFEQPTVVLPVQRSLLPAGSDALEELYRLGQDRYAWERWQIEFTNVHDPTVAEQFTDGLMRLGVGDNLFGMYRVSSLSWEDHSPEEQAAYEALKHNPDYWRAVYPFPFEDLIESWSQQRQLNPLLVTALIRQESRFEPAIQSPVGATGLMQVMPATAAWIKAQDAAIGDYNLKDPKDSIRLGTWYLDYTHNEYGNHSLFAVASYNAGPGNVAKWIDQGGYTDADDFVEKIPFSETQGYVRSVFGGYWNYLRLYNPDMAAQVAKTQAKYN